MIRRTVKTPGMPDRWMLISQVEHARLSYELACNWGSAAVDPLVPADELLAAILHHDDGWAEWERSPQVNPESGRPLSFLEMPIDEAVEIWERSIDVAASMGPLPAYLVAGHFAALVRRGLEAHDARSHWRERVDEFLERQSQARSRWLVQWQRAGKPADPSARTQALADRGLAHLQLFDSLSLWFCMADEKEPAVFSPPGGPELTWTPVGADEVTLAPWPWSRDEVRAEVTGRLIPKQRYGSRGELEQARGQALRLGWTIQPAFKKR